MTEEEIEEKIENAGYSMTDNPWNAIYVLPDGSMIDGDFDCGLRGTDHRMIECIFAGRINRYDPHFWKKVFEATGAVMLVPESQEALIPEEMKDSVTRWQWAVINEIGYELIIDPVN